MVAGGSLSEKHFESNGRIFIRTPSLLGQTLFFRTSVEPSPPVGINLETDELAFYPLLYWPITPDQPQPSAEAYARLNAYLRTGGMILFDTRDADIAGGEATFSLKRSDFGMNYGAPDAIADVVKIKVSIQGYKQ